MQTSDNQAILERLEKLERQNRRMKRAGAAILVLASVVLMMGQARPNRTVEASAFILKDAGGKTRANLMLVHGNPTLTLSDKQGVPLLWLGADADSSSMHLSNPKVPLTGFDVDVTDDGPTVRLSGPKMSKRTIGTGLMEVGPRWGIKLTDTSLILEDEAGFRTSIGIIGLVTPSTGKTEHTSAASIVLVDKDKKVLWSAP